MDAPGMTDRYWADFWRDHGRRAAAADPLVQVQRTCGGRPVPAVVAEAIVENVVARLELEPSSRVLDLCCGNGLITRAVAARSARVVGVDVSPDLIAALEGASDPRIRLQVADAREVDYPTGSFDRALLYAGLQYFSAGEAVVLLRKAHGWLGAGGMLLLGDLPDLERRWKFFDSPERRTAYFTALAAGTPLIGTWFERQWLVYAAGHAGFGAVEILDQPTGFPYSHYRFDAVLRK